jgi:hypothetical protein
LSTHPEISFDIRINLTAMAAARLFRYAMPPAPRGAKGGRQ